LGCSKKTDTSTTTTDKIDIKNNQSTKAPAPVKEVKKVKKGTLKIKADMDCELFLDGKKLADLKRNSFQAFDDLERKTYKLKLKFFGQIYEKDVDLKSSDKAEVFAEIAIPFDFSKPMNLSLLDMELLPVKAATFTMGYDISNESWFKPGTHDSFRESYLPHKVTISKPFLLGKLEVTRKQYSELMPLKEIDEQIKKYYGTKKETHALQEGISVTWCKPEEAIEFLKKLTKHYRKKKQIPYGYEFRFPTEAEWELALKGQKNFYHYGPMDEIMWYDDNAKPSGCIQVPGGKKPNEQGFYDLLGNASELTITSYRKYPNKPQTDPIIKDSFTMRGGSVLRGRTNSSIANGHASINRRVYYCGFRVALAPVIRD